MVGLQLQETGWDGAEGKDQWVLANWGEVKMDWMGSFAGPESPKPCSHKIKLRDDAIDFEFRLNCWEEEKRNIVKMVMEKVSAVSASGFNANTKMEKTFIFLSFLFFHENVKWFTLLFFYQ